MLWLAGVPAASVGPTQTHLPLRRGGGHEMPHKALSPAGRRPGPEVQPVNIYQTSWFPCPMVFKKKLNQERERNQPKVMGFPIS